jgi:hypothetical protein
MLDKRQIDGIPSAMKALGKTLEIRRLMCVSD